jgi:hypothetical protein
MSSTTSAMTLGGHFAYFVTVFLMVVGLFIAQRFTEALWFEAQGITLQKPGSSS